MAAELLRGNRVWAKGAQADTTLPTPLTERNRSAGRSPYRRKRTAASWKTIPGAPRLCPECGEAIRGGKRKFCSDRCFDAYKKDVDIPRLAKAGLAKLATLRSEGLDPSHGGEAARKRGKSNSRRAAARAEWEKLGLDLEEEKERFMREILPGLQASPIMRIVKSTGFSRYYASLVRRGLYVPHPVHYEALSNLVGTLGGHRT